MGGLTRLFRDNVWKLHELLESVISDREPQFVVGLMKELNKILGIEIKLTTTFHPQMGRTNQKLEQYLRMYIDHRLATAKFAFNNKVYTATKSSPFKVNYG